MMFLIDSCGERLAVRTWCGVAMMLAMLMIPAVAHAKGGKPAKPKPPKPDKASQQEIKWLEKMMDINSSGLALVQAETGQTTSTEIQTLCTNLQTSIGLQQTQLQGFLLTF